MYIYIYLLLSRYVNVLVFQIHLEHILLCKYFAAISVASSVQVTFYSIFTIFHSTALNKIGIILTKVKRQNVKTHTAEEIIEVCSCRIAADKKYKNINKGALK